VAVAGGGAGAVAVAVAVVADVVMGQARPLLRSPRICPEIHGSSGLGTCSGQEVPDLPSVGRLLPKKGACVLYNCC